MADEDLAYRKQHPVLPPIFSLISLYIGSIVIPESTFTCSVAHRHNHVPGCDVCLIFKWSGLANDGSHRGGTIRHLGPLPDLFSAYPEARGGSGADGLPIPRRRTGRQGCLTGKRRRCFSRVWCADLDAIGGLHRAPALAPPRQRCLDHHLGGRAPPAADPDDDRERGAAAHSPSQLWRSGSLLAINLHGRSCLGPPGCPLPIHQLA